MSEDDLSVVAPVSAAAWLILMEKSQEVVEILSVLSVGDRHSSVFFAPLLIDLTVDRDFTPAVRVPMSTYDGGVLTKVTTYCPFAMFFYNTEAVVSRFEDHGDVLALCSAARRKFAIQSYVPLSDRRPTDMAALCDRVGVCANDVMGYVVCGHGLKEMLFAGQLIPCFEEAARVQIGNVDATKIPLYAYTVFAGEGRHGDGADVGLRCADPFVVETAFYDPDLSEALFYFLFASWGQALRVCETERMIEAGLQQFVNDSQQAVKLAPFKKYHGYGSQKLGAVERDQLMVVDAVCAEVGFSFASTYLDSVYDVGGAMTFSEWPLVKSATDHADLLCKLNDFQLHLSTHVAALVFSANSILYQTRIVYVSAGKGSSSAVTQDTLMKAVRFFSGLTAMYDDPLTDARKAVRFEGCVSRDEKYGPEHLAFACSTSPHLFSSLMWFFNRMAVYSTGAVGGDAVYNHVVNASGNLCQACGGRCCHTCYATGFVRMSTRLPPLNRQPKKDPVVVTLGSRQFAEVDVIGSYGKKLGNEPREPTDAARAEEVGGFVTVDRVRYLTQIFDYCKKNSLIDPVTGEDVLTVRGKKDFVSVLTALNALMDDMVLKFTMDVRRSGHGREEVMGSTQSFNLELNPYAMSFSPLLTYQYYRVFLFIIQSLALINASAYAVDNPLTGSHVSKWVNQHFQSICGAFASTLFKKGFLHVRDTKNQKTVEYERLMDFRLYGESRRCAKVSLEVKSCKMSVSSLPSCRIKNRPISKGGKGGGGSVFFKRTTTQRRSPIRGCLSFLLYRFHDRLFPGCNLSCSEFWQRVMMNNLPKSVDIGKAEDFDALLRFVLSVTDAYDENDVVDMQPTCLVNYVEFWFHNRFLSVFGFRDYLSTIQGLTTRLTPQNHLHFPYLLGAPPKFASLAEYVLHFKQLKLAGLSPPRVSTVAREPITRSVFDARSLVTFSFGLEKFASTMTTRDVFQFGQLSYFVGGGVERTLNSGSMSNQDYRFMRQRQVLATKLVDVLIRRTRRENVLFDADVVRTRVLSALEATGDGDPELAAVMEIMRDRNGEAPEFDDVLFFVDNQEHVALSLYSRLRAMLDRGITDFTVAPTPNVPGELEMGTHDLSSLISTHDEGEESTSGLVNGDEFRAEEGSELPTKRSRL